MRYTLSVVNIPIYRLHVAFKSDSGGFQKLINTDTGLYHGSPRHYKGLEDVKEV